MNKNQSSDSVIFQVFNEIGIIQQLSHAALEKVLPDGLKMPQFSVLNHLVRLGDGFTPLQLATAFQVTKGAMTNTLNRLLNRGLIRIEPDPVDGRSKRVYLTPEGTAMREQCIQRIVPQFARLHEQFTEEEFQAVLPFLQKLRKFLDAARDP